MILPALVRRPRDEHPDSEIRLSEEETEDPDIGDLDLLFYDGRVGGEVEHLKLLDDQYLLVARPGDFPDGPTRVRDLDGVPLVAWPATSDQPRMEQALIDSGARPRIVFRTAGNETILSMVRAGLGVAILHVARRPRRRGLVRRPAMRSRTATSDSTRDLLALAGQMHPITARGPNDRDRRRDRRRAVDTA